jgi:hypothetical protein
VSSEANRSSRWDVGRVGRGKVARLRKARALAVRDAVDQLATRKVQVRIALPVPVGGHVDRQPVGKGGEVGAVIEVEPRRKYWSAWPSPECCVKMTPGTHPSTSPGRSAGRLFSSSARMVPCEAASELPIAST